MNKYFLQGYVSIDTSSIISQHKLLCQAYLNKIAELGGNNRTCGPGWEEVISCIVLSVQESFFNCIFIYTYIYMHK